MTNSTAPLAAGNHAKLFNHQQTTAAVGWVRSLALKRRTTNANMPTGGSSQSPACRWCTLSEKPHPYTQRVCAFDIGKQGCSNNNCKLLLHRKCRACVCLTYNVQKRANDWMDRSCGPVLVNSQKYDFPSVVTLQHTLGRPPPIRLRGSGSGSCCSSSLRNTKVSATSTTLPPTAPCELAAPHRLSCPRKKTFHIL